MHDVEGYSLEELEPLLEAPLGTLKSRLHRARQRLRAHLGMEPFAAGERVKP
jgi:RNA polymerase sigma-70 factor (ECF subfamily)